MREAARLQNRVKELEAALNDAAVALVVAHDHVQLATEHLHTLTPYCPCVTAMAARAAQRAYGGPLHGQPAVVKP